jgi:hypothetical protein
VLKVADNTTIDGDLYFLVQMETDEIGKHIGEWCDYPTAFRFFPRAVLKYYEKFMVYLSDE